MSGVTLNPELIAAIYEAALHPNGFSALVDLLQKAMDVRSAGAWLQENGLISDVSLTQDVQESQKPYLDYYYKLDLWSFSPAMPPDTAILGSDLVSREELERSEFFNDFAAKFDLTNPVGAVISLDATSKLIVATDRQSKALAFKETDKAVLNAAIPHIKAAMQLRQRSRKQDRPFSGSAALDALAFATIICNASGRLVHLNAAADALLSSRQTLMLRAQEQSLSTAFPGDLQPLARLIAKAATAAQPGSMMLRDRSGERAAMVLVTPVATGTLQSLGPGHAMLAIRPLEARPAFDTSLLIDLFKLSPAQAALASALYEGKSFEEIAEERRVKVSTLRTHFAEVLNRTGARGLRDLVRLLGAIPPLR